MTDVTQLLQELADGRTGAADELFPLVYAELRRLAQAHFRDERADHTLQATALLHEAYVRLTQAPTVPRNKLHFQALAARVMRNVLVDHARAKAASKRGGNRTRVELSEAIGGSELAPVDFSALDNALKELSRLNERTARVIELKFFGGLSHPEIAQLLSLSHTSVEREWRFARAWLLDRLEDAV